MYYSQVTRHMTAWFVFAAVCTITGCSGSDDNKIKPPPLGTVKGTITLDGQPLPNAAVDFVPAQARGSSGVTDTSGVYTLMYDQTLKGAAVGDHTVKIRTKVEAGTKEKLPAKYNEQSELKATVKAGENTFDFKLLSK